MPQFSPGRSGNPKGRPKGSKSLSTRLKEYLDGGRIGGEKLAARHQVADELIECLVKLATGRECKALLKAIDMILDRTEGKVPLAIEQPDAPLSDLVAEAERRAEERLRERAADGAAQ